MEERKNKKKFILLGLALLILILSTGVTRYLKSSLQKSNIKNFKAESKKELMEKFVEERKNQTKKGFNKENIKNYLSKIGINNGFVVGELDTSVFGDKVSVGTDLMRALTDQTRSQITQVLLPKSRKSNFNKLHLNLMSMPICNVGDLDIIRKDLKDAPKGENLMVTIEKFNANVSSEVLFSKKIFYDDFSFKRKLSFDFSQDLEGIAGIFVCGLGSGESISCLDREIVSIQNLSFEQKEQVESLEDSNRFVANKTIAQDSKINSLPVNSLESSKNEIAAKKQVSRPGKLYYFSPLILAKNTVVLPKLSIHESGNSILEELVSYSTFKNNVPLNKKLKNLLEQTSSRMPTNHYGKLILDLPHLEPRVCSSR